ncbi:type I DNA topoisomerase [Actinomyces vulturis]|uniref:type I DNA topoisomerase n=1 Tax=Actinomyces vulturis TaxID=1857645 RepID=UPI00082F2E01|nr:type I DNA topoisomerase [Actinomyces vulturis]
MPTKLVIVESPNKIASIANYLGPDFSVAASVGHIRDLPQPSELPADMKKGPYGRFAIDVDNDFTPYYVVNADKKKTVTTLKKALKDASELYLATDDDREGEAIAWHLKEVLKPKVPVKRLTFTEITKEAITRALDNTRDIDMDRVNAQETRRILDRLVGYEVSPVLWRKVRAGLSAGRVQSVATRMVVERERDRMAFTAATYYSVEALLSVDKAAVSSAEDKPDGEVTFTARLTSLDGRRVASGKDFDDDASMTDKARKAGVVHLHQGGAEAIASAINAGSVWVAGVENKPYKRRPSAPFTTSSLQQEASRKLRMNSRDTMSVAQRLYEGGYITYMRTDSTVLSDQAVKAARSQIAELYGKEFVPAKPRIYATKTKGAQEAHEAIRPAGDHFRTPSQVKDELSGSQFRLYELIWKRTVASQMADATGTTASVSMVAPLDAVAGRSRDASSEVFKEAGLSASGTVITFRGFLAAYEESREAGRYDDSAKDKDVRLPQMTSGQELFPVNAEASGHETAPPPRYTEASLIHALEEREIGRPSTYAATMSTIADRGYVITKGQALVPTWLAFAVTRLLEENFSDLVDYDFTASMERGLDQIAAGDVDRVAWLEEFYRGAKNPTASSVPGLRDMVENLGEIDARAINSVDIGEGYTLRVGRYGPYLEDEAGKRANVPSDIAPDELTVDKAKELFELAASDGRELGTDPESGHVIVVKNGRYGPYVTEILDEGSKDKPRTGSLFASMDMATVTLEQALQLLSLPRVVGKDPESGEEITAQNGRYGPYLKKGKDSRSLASEDEIFSYTLEQALALYAQPKRGRGATAKGPLRELGTDPATQKPVVIKDGRFGPYITDGETNVTVPRGDDPMEITEDRAYDLLADKRAKGPVKKRTTRKTTAKKTTAKKTTTRKTAAKSTAKKTTAKSTASKSAAKKTTKSSASDSE